MTDSPTPSRYQWSFKGISFDFYRLCEILGIKHHAQAHALKKVIRAGQSVKSLEQDIDEAIACLMRWKEMVTEDGPAVAVISEERKLFTCMLYDSSGEYFCTLPEGHEGNHECTTRGGKGVAVWE